VAAISSQDNPDGNDFYRPYQGFIADKSYPFIREVYIINRESFTGLGTGFTQWVASDQGQRIVLKMGLVPATMPIRLIKTKKSF
jgi:phosphate transport system substrate-binding protein